MATEQEIQSVMLLGNSRPYPWLILEETGRWTDDDDEINDEKYIIPTCTLQSNYNMIIYSTIQL